MGENLESPDIMQARLAAIVATSDDAIVSKDLNGIVQSWNAAAERIFGYTSDEMVGQSITKIIPPHLQDEEPAILERLKRGERVDHFQTIRMAKGGRLLNVSVTISPIRDSQGRIVGASKIARDITQQISMMVERDELLKAERAARMEAERLNRMKDEFLANLSHELRTPLNAILGWSELLKRQSDDPDALQEGLGVIERNARVQNQLISDLLDMSRIISGKMRLDIQRIDMGPVIEAALEAILPSSMARGITIRKFIDPMVGPVNGDAARLQQVIWNLLTNAIKFTPKGGKVEVMLGRVNSHVEIAVSDTGQGIKPDFLPHLFERFRQADASTTRKHGGLGLGLAIVKNLVELHGGTVRAKSPGEGQGSTFVIELPVALIKAEPGGGSAASRQEESQQLSLMGLTVLVVDDEEDARGLIRRVLEGHEAKVLTAESVDRALAVLESVTPDLVLSDVGMPEKDGFQLIREIRRRGLKMPAVALTAFARPEDRLRALRAGFQMHLAKPIETQELVISIASITGRHG